MAREALGNDLSDVFFSYLVDVAAGLLAEMWRVVVCRSSHDTLHVSAESA